MLKVSVDHTKYSIPGIQGKQAKLPSAPKKSHKGTFGVPVGPRPLQLPANNLEKTTSEDGSSLWGGATHATDSEEVPGFRLSPSPSLVLGTKSEPVDG